MILSRFAAPAATPVSLTEAKAHCNVIGSSDDTILQVYLDAAVALLDGAEGVLGRCMVTQTWDMTLDAFPSIINVPLPTLSSVTSITYVDADGATQTLAANQYRVSGQTITPGDAGWPSTDNVTGAVTVRFVAGYGNAAAVPAALKAAILLQVGDLFANRERHSDAAITENPAFRALIGPYRVVRV